MARADMNGIALGGVALGGGGPASDDAAAWFVRLRDNAILRS